MAVPLADISSSTHHPDVITIGGVDVPVATIRAVRMVGSRIEVEVLGDIIAEDLDTDGLTEWGCLMMALGEHNTSHGLLARYTDTQPGWWVVCSYPHPVGIAEIAEMLGVSRNTVDQWRHRGDLPGPRWTVGGRPAWEADTIRQWAETTGRDRTGAERYLNDRLADPDYRAAYDAERKRQENQQ